MTLLNSQALSLRLALSLLSLLAFSLSPLFANPVAITKPTTLAPVVDQRIDINTASAAELMSLKGVGKKRAMMIVADREANGRFNSVMELTRVKGIGPKTVKNNADKIKVTPPQTKVEAPKVNDPKVTPKVTPKLNVAPKLKVAPKRVK